MKQKFFAISAIAVLAIVGVFIFEYATLAQRPDRNAQNQQRGNRQGGERGNRGAMMGMMNPMSIVDNSWLDLTFAVKVDDETLVKARPVYQMTRDKFAAKMKELRASGNWQAMRSEVQKLVATVGPEFQAGLKEVLTEEQMAQLNKLTKERQTQMQQRGNRQGGERGRRGGGGGGGGGRQ